MYFYVKNKQIKPIVSFPMQDLHSIPQSDAFVVVFSIDDRATFERCTDLLYELRKTDLWEGPVILVANKIDLVRTRDVSPDGTVY